MDTINTLKELVSIAGISGFENDIAEALCKRLEKYCQNIQLTKNRSVLGNLRGAQPGRKTVLIEAHLDRIGLMVSEILEGGFVRFKTLGGVDERIIPASEVYILGKERCFGVIGEVPPHLKGQSAKSDKGVKLDDMVIDTGMDKQTAMSRFSVGDPILLKSEFCDLLDGRVSSAALDNRAGMAAVFECLDAVCDKALPVNVCVAFTVGEELGLQGARTLLSDNLPDLAIVVDVTHGKTPDSETTDTFALGSGVAICRGPNLHYEITKRIIDLAKAGEIPFEIEVAAGNTGTNAWSLQTLGKGIPCALVSIPLRYMHTTVETVDVDDIKSAGRLLGQILLEGGDILA